ncbi:MAG TPA: DUF4012 domain-containing protein [Acidimicrobiales bacterium]|nr:DUF4012 domain-containing protein [Acidimicrobiales bacterium]
MRAVDRAERWSASPLLSPLTAVPVLGDQVEGLRAITANVGALADAGDDALDRVEAGLRDTGEGGRLRLVRTALDAVRDVEARARELPEVDDGELLGPLRRASSRLEAEIDDLPARFDELEGHLETAHDLLEGPTRVLLVAANNAEMRAGMGMHLSAGVITVEDGDFESSRFFQTGAITLRTQGRADVPEELAALYQRIWDFGHEWRTTSTTPDFRTVGRILADLAARSPIGAIDMVVSLDVPALATMMEATGPVVVDDEVVSADNAVDVLLRDNYLRLGEVDERHERRDLQSRIAGTIFDTVTERDVDVVDLASALTDAAEGRHLMGWSADDGVQRLWESLGADGALTADSFLVAAQNASASKRDYYLDPVVHLLPLDPPRTPAEGVGDRRRYRASLELANPVVRPTAPYIDSLNRYVPVGVHRAFVTFTLPGAARDVRVIEGKPAGVGTDGPTRVATAWLRVPEGSTGRASVEFTLPGDARRLEIVPGARVRPTEYRVGPVSVLDGVPRTVQVPEIPGHSRQEPQPLAAAALVAAFTAVALGASRARRLSGPAPDLEAARGDGRLATSAALLAAVLALVAGLVQRS